MALITCPDCGRGVSDTATECPGCAAPLGFTPPVASASKARLSLRWLVPAVIGLMVLGLMLARLGPTSSPSTTSSETEQEAAQEFWSTVVAQYVNLGLITNYQMEGQIFVIYVRQPNWQLLSRKDKETLLSNVSRSNAILGRTAMVEVRDHDTARVYAILTPPHGAVIYD
jgi:hypothetical protein